MLTKAKALYQVKLILDYLSREEYKLIPQETINYIEENFEYDENIKIDPSIPLEEQKIDDKSYEVLEKIIKNVENSKKVSHKDGISRYVESVKESNKNYSAKIENIKLKNILELLKKENSKIPKAKELLEKYKESLKQKDEEIAKLKEDNEDLYKCIQKIPKIIRKIFIKDRDIKLLNSDNKITY